MLDAVSLITAHFIARSTKEALGRLPQAAAGPVRGERYDRQSRGSDRRATVNRSGRYPKLTPEGSVLLGDARSIITTSITEGPRQGHVGRLERSCRS